MRRDGSPRLEVRQPRLSETLAGEAPGLVGIEEEPSQLWFCPTGLQCWMSFRGSAGASLPPSAA